MAAQAVLLGLDRLATIYFAHPVRKAFLAPRSAGIPILMYHSIAETDTNCGHPYYEVNTSPRLFEQHIKFLRENGYAITDLGKAVEQIKSSNSLCNKSAVVTFDDGYKDFYDHAFPILQRYGFMATVFLPTGYIGATPKKFKGKDCLTWKDVRELHANGVAFGSHTATHPQLRSVSPRDMENEVRSSKQILEGELGQRVVSFSYPYAFPECDREFTKRLRALLESCGYENGVSTILGTASNRDDQFFLRRLPVSSRDDIRFFQAKLAGDYDWLHCLQYTTKFLKSKVL